MIAVILNFIIILFTFSVNLLLAGLLGAGDGRLSPVDKVIGPCAKL